MLHEDLERALVADVGELPAVHVEAQFLVSPAVSLLVHEAESRSSVDEPPNQPGTRHPVAKYIRARDPQRPTWPLRRARRLRGCCNAALREQLPDARVCGSADEHGAAYGRFAAVANDLAREPLEILEVRVRLAQDIDGVFQGHGAKLLQTSAHFHADVR